MKYFVIILIIVAIILFAVFGIPYFQKKSLVDQIMAKYSGSSNFDASPDKLMTLDVDTLKGILAGTVH